MNVVDSLEARVSDNVLAGQLRRFVFELDDHASRIRFDDVCRTLLSQRLAALFYARVFTIGTYLEVQALMGLYETLYAVEAPSSYTPSSGGGDRKFQQDVALAIKLVEQGTLNEASLLLDAWSEEKDLRDSLLPRSQWLAVELKKVLRIQTDKVLRIRRIGRDTLNVWENPSTVKGAARCLALCILTRFVETVAICALEVGRRRQAHVSPKSSPHGIMLARPAFGRRWLFEVVESERLALDILDIARRESPFVEVAVLRLLTTTFAIQRPSASLMAFGLAARPGLLFVRTPLQLHEI